MGCLPDHNTLIERYLNSEGIWGCHSDARKPCGGLIQLLESNNIPMNKNNNILVDGDNEYVPVIALMTPSERSIVHKEGPWRSGKELHNRVLELINKRRD
jgi:hypothetical protein